MIGDISTCKADLTAIRTHRAGDQIEQTCLARAIRPEDADGLAFRDIERRGVGNHDGTEGLLKS